MDTYEKDLPAYLASYLINGDATGLEERDQEDVKYVDALCDEMGGTPVSCGEETFFDLWDGLHTEMLTYTWLVNKKG